MSLHVFTYGSLMFQPVWSQVVTGRYACRPARLEGFARRRIRGADYPAIVSTPLESVDGLLYLDVEPADLARLDAFEGDAYQREDVMVRPADGGMPVPAGVYVWKDASLLEPAGWDPQQFERERLGAFITEYCGPRTAAR